MEELIEACVELLGSVGDLFGGGDDEEADKGGALQPVDPFRDIRYEERAHD